MEQKYGFRGVASVRMNKNRNMHYYYFTKITLLMASI